MMAAAVSDRRRRFTLPPYVAYAAAEWRDSVYGSSSRLSLLCLLFGRFFVLPNHGEGLRIGDIGD